MGINQIRGLLYEDMAAKSWRKSGRREIEIFFCLLGSARDGRHDERGVNRVLRERAGRRRQRERPNDRGNKKSAVETKKAGKAGAFIRDMRRKGICFFFYIGRSE
jgi:hypothetical protein